MNKLTGTLAALATAALTLTACGSSGPDVAACKTAMKQQFAQGLTNPSAPPPTRPAACEGVPDKTVQRLATEIMEGR